MLPFKISLVLCSGLIFYAEAFSISPSRGHTLSSGTSKAPVIVGTSEFTGWLLNQEPKATFDPNIRHAMFDNGSLRGLEWTGPPITQLTKVIEIPVAKTLWVSYPSEDWDVELAVQLWNEYKKGAKSDFYGYLTLLTTGFKDADDPSSLTPHAVRHWSAQDRDKLKLTAYGQRVIQLVEKEEERWLSNYQSVRKTMTYQQFEWAMEAVHSRAFCGSFSTESSLIFAVAAPLASATAGLVYSYNNPEISGLVLGALAVTAVLPLVLNLVQPATQRAVMLPLIDSANHRGDADSKLEYDPLQKTFQLSIGPNCVDLTTKQVFVRYGAKKDTELLINYGFLPDVSTSTEGSDARNALIEALLAKHEH